MTDEPFNGPEWFGVAVAGIIGGVLLAFYYAAYVVTLLMAALFHAVFGG